MKNHVIETKTQIIVKVIIFLIIIIGGFFILKKTGMTDLTYGAFIRLIVFASLYGGICTYLGYYYGKNY